MNNTIDLHSHSTKSDGSYTPNELLKYAESKGIKTLSITDHESVDAYFDMDRSLFSGRIIPGVELRTTCNGVAIELLGYGFDVKIMKKLIEQYKYKTIPEFDEYAINLAYKTYTEKGFKLNDNFISNYKINHSFKLSHYIVAELEAHPENQNLWPGLERGKSFYRTFMTNPNSCLFLDFTDCFPTPENLIKTIRKAHGYVSIPHIFQYNENSLSVLYELTNKYDIDFIECFYPTFSTEQTNFLLDFCQEHNLGISGGSDFHGTNRPTVDLGSGIKNNLYIDPKYVTWTEKFDI